MFLVTWMGVIMTFCEKTPVTYQIPVPVLKMNLEEKKRMRMMTGTKNN